MDLLDSFDHLLARWRGAFAQQRTFLRACRLTLGLLLCLRLHLTSTAICATGRQFRDWSADYRLFSRAPWDPRALFDPVFDALPQLLPAGNTPVVAALDDTLFKKTGRHIPGATIGRDPQSLPYHVNLCRGLRFVQASVLVSPREAPGPARALPVHLEPAPPAIKPRKNAAEADWQSYRQQKKACALPQVGLHTIVGLRQTLDQRPDTQARRLVMAVDGSYTNRTVLRGLPERTALIGRIRKDAKLCWPLPESAAGRCKGRPRLYGPPAPTPEEFLRDDSIPVQTGGCFAAGRWREMPVKVVGPLVWRNAGADLLVRLIIVKPLGYRLRKGSKLLYREPAFLLATDLSLSVKALVQDFVYRWEIECNHRDEKSLLGVAQGQVWNAQAVRRLPQFQVAGYSLLLLSSLQAYGFHRTADYLPLPKWRRDSLRPSTLDLLNLLRHQLFARGVGAPASPNFWHFATVGGTDQKSPKKPRSGEILTTLAA